MWNECSYDIQCVFCVIKAGIQYSNVENERFLTYQRPFSVPLLLEKEEQEETEDGNCKQNVITNSRNLSMKKYPN